MSQGEERARRRGEDEDLVDLPPRRPELVVAGMLEQETKASREQARK